VNVTVNTLVTVADVLALPIVVPLAVAVNTPVDAFTAVNPFCDEARVYALEYDTVPYELPGAVVDVEPLLNVNVS
jgi:hypothetical protein